MTKLMRWGYQLGLAAVCVGSMTACSGGPKIDREIMADLQAIATNCMINIDGNSVRKCKDKEDDKLEDKFDKKVKDRIAALDTFSAALSGEDRKVAVAAAAVLSKSFRSFGEDVAPDAISPQVAKRLIEAVGKSPKYQAAQALRTTVNAAVLAKQYDALYQMMDGHSNTAIPEQGYAQLMYYGNMDVFPKIQEVAKSEKESLAAAALKAPLKMLKSPSEADKQSICSWGKGYLNDERKDVFAAAGEMMLDCKGEYIDALLQKGEERLAKNIFSRSDYLLYRDVCFSPIGKVIEEPGVQAQCQRNYALLEKAANNESLKSRDRGLALFAIYYQRRNQETLDLMKKYVNHKDKMVSKYATEAIGSIENQNKPGSKKSKAHRPKKMKRFNKSKPPVAPR